jgi:hypothetical protein
MSTATATHGEQNEKDCASLVDQLQSIWMAALDVPAVSPGDNFIEAGGDSISATLCVNRIRAALGVDISVLSLLAEEASFDSFVKDVTQAVSSQS